MSERLPADRVFVDAQRKIVDAWLAPLKRIEPLLKYLTPENIATLVQVIQAAQDPEAGTSLSALIAALAVDNAPDFDADYAVGFDASGSEAKRIPLGLLGRSQLISSTPMSGNSTVDIVIPDTYPHCRLHIRGMSYSTTAQGRMSLSEDSGASFLAAAYELFNTASVAAAATANTAPNISPTGGSGAAAVFSLIIDIFNVLGVDDKFARLNATLNSSGSSYVGSYVFTSTAALTLARLVTTAGTFDAGIVDLWGIP